MTLVKASIRAKAGGEVRFTFNPSEYTLAKSAEWRATPTSGAPTAPTPEFLGTRPRTLTLRLLFDAWAADGESVVTSVEQLLTWMNPTETSRARGRPTPPILVFQWGWNRYFDAYLGSVDAQYTMFDNEGTPVRATVTVTLVEVPSEPGRQNPTSGARAHHRTAMLGAGESLQSIAYREYGDAALWRGLAAANGVDDPLRVAVGTRVWVPPRREVAELT